MNVLLTFDRERFYQDLGDLSRLTQQMNASGSMADWQAVLAAMAESGAQGLTIATEGSVTTTPKGA